MFVFAGYIMRAVDERWGGESSQLYGMKPRDRTILQYQLKGNPPESRDGSREYISVTEKPAKCICRDFPALSPRSRLCQKNKETKKTDKKKWWFRGSNDRPELNFKGKYIQDNVRHHHTTVVLPDTLT